jgi:transposase
MNQTEQSKSKQNGQVEQEARDPEVMPGPRYRTFSREYKLRILAAAAECERGEVGALLRREGLYYSTLSKWRQQQAAGRLEEPEARQQKADTEARELERLRREKARLEAKLARAEAIIEVQKKLSEILELEDD